MTRRARVDEARHRLAQHAQRMMEIAQLADWDDVPSEEGQLSPAEAMLCGWTTRLDDSPAWRELREWDEAKRAAAKRKAAPRPEAERRCAMSVTVSLQAAELVYKLVAATKNHTAMERVALSEFADRITAGRIEAAEHSATGDAFHAHLDGCDHCLKHPFDLCDDGKRILAKYAGVPL